jgi:hypothetical protein
MVEKAMIFFMSVWEVAASEANNAVIPPIKATTFKLCGCRLKHRIEP